MKTSPLIAANQSVTELAAHNPNLSGYLAQLEGNLKLLTQALDDIACDYEHMKRKDMVEKAVHALCKVGAWRKALTGEFVRGGKSYGFPGGKSLTRPSGGRRSRTGDATP